jgi:hypothetical protein
MRLFDCPDDEDVEATVDEDTEGELVWGLELLLPSLELLVGVLCPSDFGVTGTRGGISLGGGVRKDEEELPASLLGEPAGRSTLFRPASLLAVDLRPGDSLFRPPSLFTSFFSMGGMMGLEGEVSFPMLLHVWASRARGLFLASSYNTQHTLINTRLTMNFYPIVVSDNLVRR